MCLKNLSKEQINSIVDLTILVLTNLFAVYVCKYMINIDFDNFNLKVFFNFAFSEILFNIGLIFIMMIRKENFASFGLVKKNSLKAVLLSFLVGLPLVVYGLYLYHCMGIKFIYLPLRGAVDPQLLRSLGLVQGIIAYIIVIIVWGFLEGLTYVAINDKVNKIFKPQNSFLNPGAIFCTLFVILIHILLNMSTFDHIMTVIVAFILIYGMLVIREYTQNSWGCIFLFIFFWNAF